MKVFGTEWQALQDVTDLEMIDATAHPVKMIRNGQILILHNGKVFDMRGIER